MIPRYGNIRRGQSYRARPGAYALLIREGRVLLTLQDLPEPDYQLPGGGIEAGESAIAGLHREVIEETGWRIQPLRRIGTFRRHCYLPDYGWFAEKICHVWLARPLYPLTAPTEPGHRAIWVPCHAAAGLLRDSGSRALVQKLLGSSAEAKPLYKG